MTTTWSIGFDSWIIQDGNYPDFAVGDLRRFALEFDPHTLLPTSSPRCYCEHISGARYKVVADVVFVTDEVWVIDFGLPAYTEARAPQPVQVGGQVEGELYLGVDPFMYKESLWSIPGIPSLAREFRVERIVLETTPWISGYAGSTPTRMRDQSKESFVEVPQTDAWRDDDKGAHYVLQCELLSSG
jgi:hypothetical protein